MKDSQKEIKELGTILCVWAHPDDEAWCSVGLMKLATQNAQRVVVVTATRGGSGVSADEELWPADELAYIREEEMLRCLENLPSVEHRWLEYVDGTLQDVDVDEASEQIAQIIEELDADTLVTFEPEGITGHNDHKSVQKWSAEAIKKSNSKPRLVYAIESVESYESAGKKLHEKHNIYFNCEYPNCVAEADADILIELNEECLNCKMECLRAHQSQTNNLFKTEADVNLLKKLSSTECFIYA